MNIFNEEIHHDSIGKLFKSTRKIYQSKEKDQLCPVSPHPILKHIEAASKDEIAEVILMPGDTLRARKIAEEHLQDVKQFNQVRGMLGFTGFYRGKRINVMGSGMGFGSIGIYSYELYQFYDVNTILRIGSCGALIPQLDVMDVELTKDDLRDINNAMAQIKVLGGRY